MDSVEISTFSDDELDYEYLDEEENVDSHNVSSDVTKFKKNDDLKQKEEYHNEKDAVYSGAALFVNTSRGDADFRKSTRAGHYVDLDDTSDDRRNQCRHVELPRKSIHDRVKITAQRRSHDGNADSTLKTSNNYVDPRDLRELYESLDVDPNDSGLRKNGILVKGVDKLSEFEVKRIFAEFRPDTVQFVDETSCTVRWIDDQDVATMFLGMTKPLRRVRGPRKAEEGELLESEDEEEEVGQVKEEDGDDVAVVGDANEKLSKKRKFSKAKTNNFVEINVENVKIPSGKWRVATKHVPDNRLIIARFATGFDIRRGVINARNRPRPIFPDEGSRSDVDKDGYEYAWKSGQTRVRPGLNVFDDKGNELEWDYEHDTRFFASDSSSNDEKNARSDDDGGYKKKKRLSDKNEDCFVAKKPVETTTIIGDVEIRSRGRGSKKFLAAMAMSDSDNENDNSDDNYKNRTSTSVGIENVPHKQPSTLASDVVLSRKPTKSMPKSSSSPNSWKTSQRQFYEHYKNRANALKNSSESEDLDDYDDELDNLVEAPSPPRRVPKNNEENAMEE